MEYFHGEIVAGFVDEHDGGQPGNHLPVTVEKKVIDDGK